MTPVSPYDALVEEWRGQSDRYRVNEPITAVVFSKCARQLAAASFKDLEHAAIWRQRWEMATGCGEPVDLRQLDDNQLAAHMAALLGHRDAIRQREQTIEAEICAAEMEMEKRT